MTSARSGWSAASWSRDSGSSFSGWKIGRPCAASAPSLDRVGLDFLHTAAGRPVGLQSENAGHLPDPRTFARQPVQDRQRDRVGPKENDSQRNGHQGWFEPGKGR